MTITVYTDAICCSILGEMDVEQNSQEPVASSQKLEA